MAGKHTPAVLEMIKEQVAKLHRRGYSQWDIVGELKAMKLASVSQPMVCKYIQMIKQDYKDSAIEERRCMVFEKLEQYKEIVQEAWAAWEKLKKGKRKVVKERGDNDKGGWTKTGETTEEAEGSQYLTVIMNAHKAVRELMGLDEAVKLDVQNTHLLVSWNQVMEEMAKPYRDTVGEVIIRELEAPKE